MRKSLRKVTRHLREVARHPRTASAAYIYRSRIKGERTFLRRKVILFERHAGIGDLICTFPAVLALRQKFPETKLVYSTWKRFRPIVEMGKVADLVVEMDWSERTPKVAARDYDLIFRPWLEGEVSKGLPHVHLVDDFCRTLGVRPNSRQPRLYVPRAAAKAMKRKMARHRVAGVPVVGVHVGPSWAVKEWTTSGWNELVALLTRELGCRVIQLGAEVHTARGPQDVLRCRGAEDWVGRLTLADLVAAIYQLDVLIGIDSGLLHIAGAVGTPCVGLFGPLDPTLRLSVETPSRAVVSSVPCLGCHHRTPIAHWQDGCPNSIACMSEISAQEVTKACRELLESSRGERNREMESSAV